MKKMLIAAVLLCSLSTVAHADEASRRVKAEKLVGLMHMDRIMDQMSAAIKTQSSQMMQSLPGSDQFNEEQKKLAAEFQTKLVDLAISSMNWHKLEPLVLDVYIKTFSDEEFDAMIAFYSSPVGQSVLNKMPEVMQNSMGLIQGTMKDMMPQIQSLAEEYSEKIKAAGNK